MTDVRVYLDSANGSVEVGTAHFTRVGRAISTTFEYEGPYIANPTSKPIDPAFPLYSGNQYVARMPGVFGDSAPDRWGRNLLIRREREAAREAQRTPRSLDDVDFLLGVSDETRQGALRYAFTAGGEMQSPSTGVPRLVALPELLRASDAVAADDDGHEAYKILLAAGTGSLGGARPKASVRLHDGALGIAKFPHSSDEWDVMAWEAVSLELAKRAHLRVPHRKLVRVGERCVLLIGRFDRGIGDERIGYMSAMTLLGLTDGDTADYVDLIEAMADVAVNLNEDRRELFDRVVLSMAIHNTDDHLRNHGFLAVDGGWRLSPIFDINPNPEAAAERAMSVGGATDVAREWDGLMELARIAGLDTEEARGRIGRVLDAVATWAQLAEGMKIPSTQRSKIGAVIDERVEDMRRRTGDIDLPSRASRGRNPHTVSRGKTTPSSTAGSFAPRGRGTSGAGRG